MTFNVRNPKKFSRGSTAIKIRAIIAACIAKRSYADTAQTKFNVQNKND